MLLHELTVFEPSHHPFEWLALWQIAITVTVGRRIIEKQNEKITYFLKKKPLFSI
jgi:hypothetical protein